MINWFPLPRSLMESPIFIMQTPLEKLYLLYVASEMNLRGPFYKADLEIAVTMGASEDKLRRIRREDMRLGWVLAEPGFRSAGRHLATRYKGVPGARREDGDFYAPLHRFTFEALLHYLRQKRLTHADLVTYVYLTYFKVRTRRDDDWFFISKNQLRELTGIPSATVCVDHLYTGFTFTGGSHLIEYRDESHRLVFSKWSAFADPSANENNAKNAEHYRTEVAAAVQAVKHPTPKRVSGRRAVTRV